MRKRRIVVYIIIAGILELSLFYFLNKKGDSELKLRLQEENNQFNLKAQSSIRTFNLVSTSIYSNVINKEPVLAVFNRAATADNSEEKNAVRHELYEMLRTTYEELRQMNIKQLHFHLPNNESFLRFHRPAKYGDNLTPIRYSVRMTNITKNEYRGFEEGRIYNGFRNVFPLHYQGTHIGSIETSFSFEAIRKELQKHGVKTTAFLVRKDVVDAKVFSSEQYNYVPALVSDEYVHEYNYSHHQYDTTGVLQQIDREIKERVHDRLTANESFSVLHKHNNTYYVISFISIWNVEGIPAAYFVSYSEDTQIHSFIERTKHFQLVALLFIPVLLLFVFLYIDGGIQIRAQNKKLKISEDKLQKINEELHLQATELKKYNEELLKVNAEKERFYSIIAHDLRNPFSALINMMELVETECSIYENPSLNKYCYLIKNTLKRSYDLLENLLHWTRWQMHRFNVNMQATDIEPICEKITDLLQVNSTEKQIEVSVNIEPGLKVYTDIEILEIVIRNLLSNAIKFTHPGGEIYITASAINDHAQIIIEDSGVGINPDKIENIFNIEQNSTTQGTNKEIGTGLGLPLCKELIEMQEGKIWAESEINKGSKFIIELKGNI